MSKNKNKQAVKENIKTEEELNEEVESQNEIDDKKSNEQLLQERIKELEDDVLKAKAELVNYRKRKDDEVSKLLKYSEEKVMMEFLPILDNFERAIELDDDNLTDELSKFLEGFKMIYASAKNLLDKFEVKEISALGEMFNPNYHQAVLTDKIDDKESGVIIDVFQKGYIYKDKVIRPSMVKVNE